MPACRYVEKNGSATMLAVKGSAGVAPEVNLREHVTHTPLANANKALKPRGGISRSPEQGYHWPRKIIYTKDKVSTTYNNK